MKVEKYFYDLSLIFMDFTKSLTCKMPEKGFKTFHSDCKGFSHSEKSVGTFDHSQDL